MIGTDGADDLDSGPCGKALIEGGGGNDEITARSQEGGEAQGGPGTDTITSSFADDLRGGRGNDTLWLRWTGYDDARYPMRVDGGPGNDSLKDDIAIDDTIDLRHGIGYRKHGRVHLDVPVRRVENAGQFAFAAKTSLLIGTRGPNILVAPRDHVYADGPHTRSVVRGLAGNDTIRAGHHDTAYGGRGHDVCRAQHRVGCEAR
jgi:hypothetical protein